MRPNAKPRTGALPAFAGCDDHLARKAGRDRHGNGPFGNGAEIELRQRLDVALWHVSAQGRMAIHNQLKQSLHHAGWRPCRRIAEYVQATENRQHRIRRDRGNSRRVWAFARIEFYYVNYGWLDEPTDRGYWLLVDAKQGRRSK